MTIALTTSPGGLFRRVGRMTYVLNSVNSFRGTADLSAASIVSLGVGTTNILGQFASADQQLMDLLYTNLESARSALSGYTFFLSQLASNTVVEMANDDTPLFSKTPFDALTLLIAQMTTNSESVNANTVSVSVATGSSNTGTAVCIASVKGPNGKDREYVIAEAITLTASTDSQSASATAGQESWAITSPVVQGDQLSWDWPKGSGSSTALTASAVDGSQQLLANGNFETWTVSNIPDLWTVLVGAAGADILRSSTVFAGTYALSFLGDGSTLTAVRQVFNDSSAGTATKLLPNTVYAINLWVRVSVTPAAGVLKVTLTNSAGTAMTNDAGTTLEISKALTAVSTTWVAVNGFIQTPRVMPAEPQYLKIHLSTALTSGRTVYIDNLTLARATEIYPGGPYVAVFPGATATVKNDTFTLTVANDWGGAFQKAFQRIFDMRSLGLAIPSNASAAETILDSLVA